MLIVKSFIFVGLVCGICQIIIDNTKLNPGDITVSLTIIGALLSFFDIYDKIINYVGTGAKVLISNFGYLLYSSGYEGYLKEGLIGVLNNLLSKSSLAIVSVIVLSFVFTLLYKARD